MLEPGRALGRVQGQGPAGATAALSELRPTEPPRRPGQTATVTVAVVTPVGLGLEAVLPLAVTAGPGQC